MNSGDNNPLENGKMNDNIDTPINELKRQLLRKDINIDEYNRLFPIVSLEHTWIKPRLNEWLPLIGAALFGLMVGWIVQRVFVSSDADSKLLTSVVGVIGGGAITALFPARSILFGSYSIGLAVGFFLCILIEREPETDKPVEQSAADQPPTRRAVKFYSN